MDNEIWLPFPHPEYCEKYKISNMGRVLSLNNHNRLKWAILKPQFNKKRKYSYISVQNKNKRRNFILHRAVALAFVPNKNKSLNQVDHIDFDRKNNKASNLQWCTRSFNMMKTTKAGRMFRPHGELCGLSKLTEKQVKRIRKMDSLGINQDRIAKKFSIAPCTVSQIVNRKRWTHI